MILYILPTPMNKLDVKQRVSGWRHVPLEHKGKAEWRGLLAQVKDKGVEYVVASDLDEEAARTAGDELHIPVHTERALRRFCWGEHHGKKLQSMDGIFAKLEEQWKENADIPVRHPKGGGDSLTSFMKRFARRLNTLLSGTGTALLVTDVLTIAFIRDGMTAHAIIPNGNPVKRNKIYKVTNGSSEQMHHAT